MSLRNVSRCLGYSRQSANIPFVQQSVIACRAISQLVSIVHIILSHENFEPATLQDRILVENGRHTRVWTGILRVDYLLVFAAQFITPWYVSEMTTPETQASHMDTWVRAVLFVLDSCICQCSQLIAISPLSSDMTFIRRYLICCSQVHSSTWKRCSLFQCGINWQIRGNLAMAPHGD